MSAGAKVTLVIVVLFVVLIGVYYGLGSPADPLEAGTGIAKVEDSSDAATSPPFDDSPVESIAERPNFEMGSPIQTAGILGDSVARGLQQGRSMPPAEPSSGRGDGAATPVVQSPVASGPTQPPGAGTALSTTAQGDDARRSSDVTPIGKPRPDRAPPRVTAAATTEVHIVDEGESLWTIAEAWFGTGIRWREIAAVNPGMDPNNLDVGQRLNMPARRPSAAKPAASRRERAASDGTGVVHTVRIGDTLTRISQTYYGTVRRWKTIYDSNVAVIGDDPDRLDVGMKLRIPAR